MIKKLFPYAAFIFFATGVSTGSFAAGEHIAEKHKFSLPPSADLHYTIEATQRGFPISGEGLVSWRATDAKYSIVAETRVIFLGKIMASESEGTIDEFGLAPIKFVEKGFRKAATTTRFNRENKLISFSESTQTYPVIGGEQDRTSISWQLAAVARAAPESFVAGSEWTFFVAGRRDGQPWTFRVIKQESISTPFGALSALHLSRTPPPDAKKQHLDIWLAPSLEWYPARIRFSEADDDFIEQKLKKIEKR